jgi:DNA helicase-2/ATP-dependent DNA helicase PcrA
MELIPPDKSIRTLDEFMQEITLLTTVDKEDEKDTDNNKVSMMTIHAAKGLEFPFVYIVGMEENLFPSQLSINNRADLEEERRLFYVAVTRAEKQATLSYAGMRYRYGNVTYCEPSRFIDEIDDKYLDFAEEPESPSFSPQTFDRFREAYQQETRNQKTLNFQPQQKKLISLNKAGRLGSGSADLAVNQSLQKGDQVYHEKFGSGEVISLEGPWPETKATIQFAQGGIKSLLLKFAKLTKQ